MNTGIDRQISDRMMMGEQALQQRYAQSQELIDLLALQALSKEKEEKARAIQASMQSNPATVKDQLEQKNLAANRQGIASMMPGVQMQGQRMQQARARQMAGIPSQSAPNMARMAGGGIVAFQEGGMADTSVQEYVRLSEKLKDPNITPEAAQAISMMLEDMKRQAQDQSRFMLDVERARGFDPAEEYERSMQEQGMYGGGEVKRYQTGDVVVGNDTSLPDEEYVARNRVTGNLLTASDLIEMRRLGQEDRIAPLREPGRAVSLPDIVADMRARQGPSEDYTTPLEMVFGERVADAIHSAARNISERAAGAFEGRELSTDKSLLENLGTIIGGGIETASETSPELIEAAGKAAYGVGEELLAGVDTPRVVGNIVDSASERGRGAIDWLSETGLREDIAGGLSALGVPSVVEDLRKRGSDYLLSRTVNGEPMSKIEAVGAILNDILGGDGSTTPDESTPTRAENFVERRDTSATTPVSTTPTTITDTPTTSTTGESGSGDGEGEGEERRMSLKNIDMGELAAFLAGGAGATNAASALAGGARGREAFLSQKEANKLKREALQLQSDELEMRRNLMEEQNRLRTLADLYPSIAAEAEVAWGQEKNKLEREAGKGLLDTDIFWRSEAEAIEARKIQFMNDYIQNKTRSMGLGGEGSVGETITDFSSYNPSR